MHFSDAYELCLGSLEMLLERQPGMTGALVCKTDTLIHLNRYDEAWDLADRVFKAEPANSAAWDLKGSILAARGEWQELLDFCNCWEKAPIETRNHIRWIALSRATACCALGRLEEMEHWIQQRVTNMGGSEDVFRRVVYSHAGLPQPHLETMDGA